MDCQQYTSILNVFLDGEIENLPEAAKKHAEACKKCKLLTHDLGALRTFSQPLHAVALTEIGKSAITQGVRKRMAAHERKWQHAYIDYITRLLNGLRWGRVVAVAAVAAILVLTYSQFQNHALSQKTTLNAEDEIEALLEEHTLQMENSIFHTDALPTSVVATVASSRK